MCAGRKNMPVDVNSPTSGYTEKLFKTDPTFQSFFYFFYFFYFNLILQQLCITV